MNITPEQIIAMLKANLTVNAQGEILGIEKASEQIVSHLEKLFCKCGEYVAERDKVLTFCAECGRLHKWIPSYE